MHQKINVLGLLPDPAPRHQAIAAHPALATAPPPPEKLSPEEFPEDIENEANSYYQKIYESEQMTIQQVNLGGSCMGWVLGACPGLHGIIWTFTHLDM